MEVWCQRGPKGCKRNDPKVLKTQLARPKLHPSHEPPVPWPLPVGSALEDKEGIEKKKISSTQNQTQDLLHAGPFCYHYAMY